MEAKELRIGNWVNFKPDNGNFIVSGLDCYNTYSKTINGLCENDCDPIPLSEKWLLKFGGNCTIMKGYPIYFLNPFNIEFYELEFLFQIGNRLVKIKHVHELQNLYYALTKQELTIKY